MEIIFNGSLLMIDNMWQELQYSMCEYLSAKKNVEREDVVVRSCHSIALYYSKASAELNPRYSLGE